MKTTSAAASYSKAEELGQIASGTRQEVDALRGAGLLQSPEEWEARNRELAGSLNGLLKAYLRVQTHQALDVGCMDGSLTDRYGVDLGLDWYGVDPDLKQARLSSGGAHLSHGFAHQLDFPDAYFDCIVFANVYEHIPPALREASLLEFYRVLTPGGILVGQLPNPYFPIESHSRLPFLGYLPRPLQRSYWRLSPTGWDFENAHFFSVTIRNLEAVAAGCGFRKIRIRNFNYSSQAIPQSVRWIASLHGKLHCLPWSWQFVLRKPMTAATSEH